MRFEVRAVEKRDAIGTRTFIDTDFALITPQGSRGVVEKVVEEWFAQLEKSVEDGRFNPLWLDAFRSYHAKWKGGGNSPERLCDQELAQRESGGDSDSARQWDPDG